MTSSREASLRRALFPQGEHFNEPSERILLDEYKLFVDTSERLVARRQTMNTFFLSINALVVSAIGAFAEDILQSQLAIVGTVAISTAGILLCQGWRTLVKSYRQLNAGKFSVIHLLEQHLPAALFKAEWEALGKGEDKTRYVPSTKTEAAIPIVFEIVYGVVGLGGLLYILIRESA